MVPNNNRRRSHAMRFWQGLLALTSIMIVPAVVYGADIGLELEVGVGRTDNAGRTVDDLLNPAVEEVIYNAGLAVTLEHEGARSNVDLRGSVFFIDYKDSSFDSQTLPVLDASAVFKVVGDSLRWFVQGNIGQQAVDPFAPVTPENRQNIAYMTTGPTIFVPLSRQSTMILDAWYSDVRYEEQPLDNGRTGARLSLAREIAPNRSLSLNARGEKTEFDLDTLFEPIDRYDAFFEFFAEGSRNELTLDLGWSRAERDGDTFEEPLATLEWIRQLSQRTSLTTEVGTRLSDAAEDFRDAQERSEDFEFVQNQLPVTDPFRQNFGRVALGVEANRTNLTFSLGWNEEEYFGLSQFDRQQERAAINLSRQLSQSWAVGLFASLNKQEFSAFSREDEDLRSGLGVTWNGSRTIEAVFRIEHFKRDSTDAQTEYTENRAYIGIRYIPEFAQ